MVPALDDNLQALGFKGRRVKREELLIVVAQRIARVRLAHPLRVAIDGIDGARKTFLADELADVLDGVFLQRDELKAHVLVLNHPIHDPSILR